MPETNKMAKADFVTGLIFLVLGIYMVLEGLKMPGVGGFIELGGEPGRVPIMIGGTIAFLALLMLLRSSHQGGWQVWKIGQLTDNERIGGLRTVLTAAGCTFYALGLIGGSLMGFDIPYEVATAIFIFLFIVGFEGHQTGRLRLMVMAGLQAVIITGAVVYLFEQKFYVVLP